MLGISDVIWQSLTKSSRPSPEPDELDAPESATTMIVCTINIYHDGYADMCALGLFSLIELFVLEILMNSYASWGLECAILWHKTFNLNLILDMG